MATSNIPGQAGPSVPLDAAAVFDASVQLPMFDKAEPDAWFILADANFNLRKVTDSRTKYWYVLSKFDSTTLRKLSTFLKRPRSDDPYQELRDKLCQTYEPPLEQKIDALLAVTDMGDERPVEFGLELQHLALEASINDILKQIFLRCLLQHIITAITSSLNDKFETIMMAADKAWTAAVASGMSTSMSAASVAAITRTSSSAGRRGRCQRGSRSASQTTTLTLCSFHKKFGDATRKCAPGCSHWSEDRPHDTPATSVFHGEESLDGEDANVGTASEKF